MTVVDAFTHWVDLVSLPNKEAHPVAKEFLDSVVNRHGNVQSIVTDCGKEFTSNILKELCVNLKNSKILTSPHRPQGNGLVERFNRQIIDILRTVSKGDPNNWDTLLSHVMSALNTAHHSAIGESPYFVLYHRDPTIPFSKLWGGNGPQPEIESSEDRLSRMKEIFLLVKANLQKAYDKYSSYYNTRCKDKHIKVGSKVLKKNEKAHGPSRKFSELYSGPYRVIEVQPNGVTFKIKHLDSGKIATAHSDRLKHIWDTPVPYDPFPGTLGAEEDEDDTEEIGL